MSKFRRQLIVSNLSYAPIVPILPYDYEVEYLETDGGPYIDLGIKGNSTSDALYIDYQVSVVTNQARFIAANSANSPCQIYQNGSGFPAYRQANNWYGISDAGVIGTGRHAWMCDYKNLKNTIDGIDYPMDVASTGITSSNLLLCGPYTSNPRFQGKIYACKIYRNDVLLIDLIPVVAGTIGYMFDKVSGELFSNSGSGAFTFGSPITNV